MNPEISIVMPVWRPDPVHFRAAIESVLLQSFRAFELIIVEDPSESSGGEIAASFDDDRIHYQVNSSRTSQVEQYNRGLSLARGLYVAAFDADDICEPQRLEIQKDYLDANPEIGGVGCQLLVIDAAGNPSGWRRYPTGAEEVRKALRRMNAIPNPGLMFRRELIELHGGWTAGRNGVARDYEWLSRLSKQGVAFANSDQYLLRYRIHSSSLTRRKVRPTLATTLEVKRQYWTREMDAVDILVFRMEQAFQYLPPALVMTMFRLLRLKRGAPPVA